MTDVIAVIAQMSWWVKSAWLVWLAWLALQVGWYRRGRLASSSTVAPARPERVDASRRAPVATTAHSAADTVQPPTANQRRRRRGRRAPEVTTDVTAGVEAAR
jgi:hypothetical protein